MAPLVPAIIAAARTLAASGSQAFARGSLLAGRTNIWQRFTRRAVTSRAPVAEPWMGRRISHEQAAENVRNFYQLARRRFGTPRPEPQQYHQFAREISDEQQRRQSQHVHQETTRSLSQLARQAVAVAGGFAVLKTSVRDYSSAAVQRGDNLREFDSRIGSAMARYDVGELRRTYGRASAVGSTTAALVDARRQRADSWAPTVNELENFGNIGRVFATRAQAWLGGLVDKIGIDNTLKAINEKLAKWLQIDLEKDRELVEQHKRQLRIWLNESGQLPRNRPPGNHPPIQ